MMNDVKIMPPEEMNKAVEKFNGMCNCPKCPTHNLTHNKCVKNAKDLFFA